MTIFRAQNLVFINPESWYQKPLLGAKQPPKVLQKTLSYQSKSSVLPVYLPFGVLKLRYCREYQCDGHNILRRLQPIHKASLKHIFTAVRPRKNFLMGHQTWNHIKFYLNFSPSNPKMGHQIQKTGWGAPILTFRAEYCRYDLQIFSQSFPWFLGVQRCVQKVLEAFWDYAEATFSSEPTFT